MFRFIASLCALAIVSGCGFHVRGALNLPSEMQQTYIATDNRHSRFYQVLRQDLKLAGIELVDSPADASAIFTILADDTAQRVLSVSARNVPTEYEVYYTVSYSLESGPDTLMKTRTQTQVRDYTWDETLVLGKEQEQRTLRDSIVDDLVRVIMIQLSAL